MRNIGKVEQTLYCTYKATDVAKCTLTNTFSDVDIFIYKMFMFRSPFLCLCLRFAPEFYVGKTGCSLSTRKKEHVKAVKEMNLQKSTFCQYIATCDHFIAWDNAYILKIEPHYRKRRIAESFSINKRAKVVNVLNQSDGLVLPSIYSMLLD